MADVIITPDEMHAAGIRLTPAEMKGRSYAQPRSMSQDDQALGLMSGPMREVSMPEAMSADSSARREYTKGGNRDVQQLDDFSMDPSLDVYHRARRETVPSESRYVEQDPSIFETNDQRQQALERSRSVTDPLQVDPLLQFGVGAAQAQAVGAPLRLLAPAARAAAPATATSTAPAYVYSNAAAAAAPQAFQATGADLMQLAAKLLLHGPAKYVAGKLLPGAASMAGSAAAPLATGATAAGELAAYRDQPDESGTPEERAERAQRAARMLLGASPNFVER